MRLLFERLITGVLFCILALVAQAAATQRPYHANAVSLLPISVTSPIPGSVISALVQDQQGFMWIGTNEGLFRYDGYELDVFRRSRTDAHTLPHNYVSSLWVDPNNKVWIGTMDGGLAVLDPVSKKVTRFPQASDGSPGILDSWIVDLIGDDSGRVWVGTNRGVNLVTPDADTELGYTIEAFEKADDGAPGIRDSRIRALALDETGRLWIGHWRGLDILNVQTRTVTPVVAKSAGGIELHDTRVNELYFSDSTRVWIGTIDHGLAYMQIGGEELVFLAHHAQTPSNQDTAIEHDGSWVVTFARVDDNMLWVGTYGDGIREVNLTTATIEGELRPQLSAPGAAPRLIKSLLVDRSGLVWVGTWDAGLLRHNPATRIFNLAYHAQGVTESLSEGGVGAILQRANGEIWLGKYNAEGVDVLNRQLERIETLGRNSESQVKVGRVRSMLELPDQSVLLGTVKNGLVWYDDKTQQFKRFTQGEQQAAKNVDVLLFDGAYIWVGGAYGLQRIDFTTRAVDTLSLRTEGDPLFRARVVALAQGPDGRIYAGSENRGLFVVNDDLTLSRALTSAGQQDATDNGVMSLFVDAGERFWLQTQARLSLLEPGRSGALLSTPMNDRIGIGFGEPSFSLQPDQQGNLWHKEGVIYRQPLAHVGLTPQGGLEVGKSWLGTHTLLADGRLAFGGIHGLAVFDPTALRRWDFTAPLAITRLTIDGSEQAIDPNLPPRLLEAGTKTLSVAFSALDFSNPNASRYAYRLSGFDDRWQNVDAFNRKATYTNLDPGRYELMIKGTNSMGDWSDQRVAMEIHMQPFWYQTLAVRIGASIVAVILLIALFSWRLRVVMLRERLLQNSERMAAIGRLTAGFAHEIKNPLTAILAHTQIVRRRLDVDDRSATNMAVIEQEIHRCIGVIKDLMLYADNDVGEHKHTAVDLNDVVQQSVRIIEALVRESSSALTTQLNYNIPKVFGNENQLKQVLLNLLINALQSKDGQPVNVKITTLVDGVCVKIMVKDDGNGIRENLQKKIFDPFVTTKGESGGSGLGLSVVHGVIKAHGGEIYCKSKINEGTLFTIVLPRQKQSASQLVTGQDAMPPAPSVKS